MRDLDRWKDKVELQLDGRQIFFLFFGSALCACLIFVLGVVVGKRVEARTTAHAQSPAEDPLAALDELGNAEEALTFHSALAEARAGRKGKGAKDAPQPAQAKEGKEDARDAVSPPPTTQEARTESKPAAEGKPAAEAGGKPALEAKVEGKPATDGKPAAPKDKQVAQKVPTPTPPEKDKDKADKVPAKGHFTLQLSAFATKAEASDFVRRLRESGYKPYVIESVVPGKGLMYRVRLGDYQTREGALSAKGDFERKQKIVAYVAKL